MPQPEITGTGGCSLPEMAMLTANFAAIETAQPRHPRGACRDLDVG